MRIVIDLQGAQGASRFRGLGRFSLWFAKSILENNKNHHDIHILLNGHFQEAIDAIRLELKNLISTDNILIFYPLSNTAYILGSHDKRSISENMYKAFIDSLIPDALIIASFFEGYTDACIFAVDDNRSYKTFSVLYDLIPYLFPEIYFSNEDYKNFYLAHLEKFKKIDYFFFYL